jgi:hypothetical protein
MSGAAVYGAGSASIRLILMHSTSAAKPKRAS